MLGELLIESFGANAIGVAFDGQLERRISEHDAGYFGQLLACQRTERELAGVKEHVRHIDDQAASGVASFQDQAELLEETRTKLFAVANGLLKLRIGGGCGGAIPVGIRFSGLLFLPCFIAVSFGVGLSTSGLMSGGLRIEVLAVCVITLANGVGGNGFGVDSAL